MDSTSSASSWRLPPPCLLLAGADAGCAACRAALSPLSLRLLLASALTPVRSRSTSSRESSSSMEKDSSAALSAFGTAMAPFRERTAPLASERSAGDLGLAAAKLLEAERLESDSLESEHLESESAECSCDLEEREAADLECEACEAADLLDWAGEAAGDAADCTGDCAAEPALEE